jgi:hypothetical protein
MTPLLKDADNLLLSLPILACATAGAVGRLMEQHSNPIIKGSGWLGSRISMVTGIISGVPLLVYNFAKTIFAKLLNTMTFNRFETLQNFAHFCELRLDIAIVALPSVPVAILSAPYVIRTGIKAYQIINQAKEIFGKMQITIDHVRNARFKEAIDSLNQFVPSNIDRPIQDQEKLPPLDPVDNQHPEVKQ